MKKTLYFYHEQWLGFRDEQREFAVYNTKIDDNTDITKSAHLRIFLHEAEVDLPCVELLSEKEVKLALVGGLRKAKDQVQAEAHIKTQQIDEKIQQLLCIENKVVS